MSAVPSKSMPALIVPKPVQSLPGVGAEEAGAVDRSAGERVGIVRVVAAGQPERLAGRVDVHDPRDVEPGRRPHVAGDVDRAVDVDVVAGQQGRVGVVVDQAHDARAVEGPLGVGIVEIDGEDARSNAVVDAERVDAAAAVDAAKVFQRRGVDRHRRQDADDVADRVDAVEVDDAAAMFNVTA